MKSFLSPVTQYGKWVKCYRAMTDGWESYTFHSKCDFKGPTVTFIRVGNYIFGGYAGVSWQSEYQSVVLYTYLYLTMP